MFFNKCLNKTEPNCIPFSPATLNQHVAPQCQFAEMRRGAVGDNVAGGDHVALLHQWALGDAGVLVRALELGKVVNVHARRRMRRLF